MAETIHGVLESLAELTIIWARALFGAGGGGFMLRQVFPVRAPLPCCMAKVNREHAQDRWRRCEGQV